MPSSSTTRFFLFPHIPLSHTAFPRPRLQSFLAKRRRPDPPWHHSWRAPPCAHRIGSGPQSPRTPWRSEVLCVGFSMMGSSQWTWKIDENRPFFQSWATLICVMSHSLRAWSHEPLKSVMFRLEQSSMQFGDFPACHVWLPEGKCAHNWHETINPLNQFKPLLKS